MQRVTKNELLELVNLELEKLPNYVDSIKVADIKQEGTELSFWFDFAEDDTGSHFLAKELLEQIDPIFNGKYLIE